MMQRILVIGSGGSGKSVLARRVADRLGLPIIHLDARYWRRGWSATPKDEWADEVARLLAGDAWVMDGNYSGTLDLRIPAADTIILLDLPRLVCLWRVAKRRLLYRGRSRPDMHPGCPERLTWQFIAWIWNYPRRQLPRVLERLRSVSNEKRIVILRSPAETERFLSGLGESERNAAREAGLRVRPADDPARS